MAVRKRGIIEYLQEIQQLSKKKAYCELRLTNAEVNAVIKALHRQGKCLAQYNRSGVFIRCTKKIGHTGWHSNKKERMSW